MLKRSLVLFFVAACAVGGAVYAWTIRQAYQLKTYKIHIVWSHTSPLIFIEMPNRKFLMVNTGVGQDIPTLVARWRYFFEKKIDYVVTTGTQSYAKKGLYWLIKKFSIGTVFEPSVDGSDRTGLDYVMTEIEAGNLRLLPLLDSKGRCTDECSAVFICRNQKCFLYGNVFRKSSQKVLVDFILRNRIKIASVYLGKMSGGDRLSKELVSALGGAQVHVSPSGKGADLIWNSLARDNQEIQVKEKPLPFIRVPVGEEVSLEL